MKILYLTEHNPLGAGCGAVARTYAIWKALRTLGEVTTVVLDGKHPQETNRDAAEGISYRRLPDLYRGWSQRNPVRFFSVVLSVESDMLCSVVRLVVGGTFGGVIYLACAACLRLLALQEISQIAVVFILNRIPFVERDLLLHRRLFNRRDCVS